MASFAILRIEKRRDIGSIRRTAEHHLRFAPPPNADPAGHIRVLHGPSNSCQVTAEINGLTKPLMKRRDAVRAIDVFMGASPDYFTSERSVHQFEQLALAWARETFGEGNIISAVTHQDEKTPHVHLMLVPITPKGNLSASHWVDGPKKLRSLQDTFAKKLAPLGLQRGIKNSKARHEDIQRWYSRLLPSMQSAERKIREALDLMAAAERAQLEIAKQKNYVRKIFSALTAQQKREISAAFDSRMPTELEQARKKNRI